MDGTEGTAKKGGEGTKDNYGRKLHSAKGEKEPKTSGPVRGENIWETRFFRESQIRLSP